MADCTHDCSTCGGEACGCDMELPTGKKPRDILKELKQFAQECESEDMVAMFDSIAADLDKELS